MSTTKQILNGSVIVTISIITMQLREIEQEDQEVN